MITRWKAGSDRRRLRRRRLAPPGADPVALDDGMNGVVAERAAPAGRHLGGLFIGARDHRVAGQSLGQHRAQALMRLQSPVVPDWADPLAGVGGEAVGRANGDGSAHRLQSEAVDAKPLEQQPAFRTRRALLGLRLQTLLQALAGPFTASASTSLSISARLWFIRAARRDTRL